MSFHHHMLIRPVKRDRFPLRAPQRPRAALAMPVVVGLTGFTFCGQQRVAAQMPVAKVVVAQAKMVEARSTLTLVATLEPVRRSRVSSETAGLVQDMSVRQGDFVRASEVICRLRDDATKLQWAAEKAKLASLQASYDELRAGTRKEELRRLKALLDEAKTQDDRWQFEMARINKLYAGRDSNDKEYQDTRASFLAAERRKIAAEAAYNLGLEGPRAEAIARAAHDVAQQQAIADRLAVELKKRTLRAPFDGYIVDRAVEVGEWVDEGDTVVEMVDLRSVLARVDVPESAFPFLVMGDPVRVQVDALDKRSFEGVLKHIMRQADRSARTFPVEIELDNTAGLLAGGMFARATLPAGPQNRLPAVPKDAIVERGGVTYVATIIPGRKGQFRGVLTPVTVGLEVNEWITITSENFQPGARVVTRGTERIAPFPTPVEIVDEYGTPVAMPTGGEKQERQESDNLSVPKRQNLEGT